MVKAPKTGLDMLQLCNNLASHWVEDIDIESAIAVWASVFALKTKIPIMIDIRINFDSLIQVFKTF